MGVFTKSNQERVSTLHPSQRSFLRTHRQFRFVSYATRLHPVIYVHSTLHCISPQQPAQSQAAHVVVDQAVHHQRESHLEHRAGCFSSVLEVCSRQVVVAMLVDSAAVSTHRKCSAGDPAVMALQSLLRGKVGHWRTVRTKAEQWDPQRGCSRCG